ncbi:MAG: dTMP kinase [Candidatus Izimaplasma sp.]|nr:dTMP kinase [Candidatus Izimaplasma bacterium]
MTKLFITFEGPEGSGKTSVIKHVKRYLTTHHINSIITREPGGIKISEAIRDIILDKNNTEMDAHTEALLFAASRSQHFHEKIVPELEKGTLILCDRFLDSSLAYQGYARNLGIDKVLSINKFGIGDHLPDLTIFIDVPPEVGLKRVFANQRETDRLDLETLAFHKKVYEGYQLLAKRFPKRIKIVDGTQSKKAVIADTIELIKPYL